MLRKQSLNQRKSNLRHYLWRIFVSWLLLCFSRCQVLPKPRQHQLKKRIKHKLAIAGRRARPQSMISTIANAKVPQGTSILGGTAATRDHREKMKAADGVIPGTRTVIGTGRTIVNVSVERSARDNAKGNARRTANERKIGSARETVIATTTGRTVVTGPIASDF